MAEDIIRVIHHRRRIVAGFPLSAAVAQRIQELVGGDCEVVDIRRADGHERTVLAPPASPQLLARLKAAFPDARILIVELSDSELGIRLEGPVTRALDAGADAYVVARSLPELADVLKAGATASYTASAQAALGQGLADHLSAALDDMMAKRRPTQISEERQRRRPSS